MMQLYRNIKNRRTELGMTQDELARLVGYSDRTSIAKIESGKVDLQQSKIALFAKALRTTQSELMGWEEEDESNEIKTIAAHAIDDLTEEEQLQLINYAKFLKSQRNK